VLYGVAAIAPNDAWAVGDYSNGGVYRSLVLHWNGTKWRRIDSPSPAAASGASTSLLAVTATSGSNAWAAGNVSGGTITVPQTVILHWNGNAWRRVSTPNPGAGGSELQGVSATSASDAWAAGYVQTASVNKTLIMHWNGSVWRQVSSPDPAGPTNTNELDAVYATSSGSAWAVGDKGGTYGLTGLLLHWNGSAWKPVRLPSPNATNTYFLSAVGASSASDVWTVGFGRATSQPVDQNIAFHCC
jgi:hypothetical protein